MIGHTLKTLLDERNMNVHELARLTDISPQTLYSIIKRDNMKCDFDILIKICKALDVPVQTFYDDGTGAIGLSKRELDIVRKYRELDERGKMMVWIVLENELKLIEAGAPLAIEPELTRIIPLYYTPAAAGYASPAIGDDYEDYVVPATSRADFAAKIQGDSMEPWIHDGDIVLIERQPVENGDVGLFFVDGDMKCKQYYHAPDGIIHLLSLNRDRADADTDITPDSSVTLCCFGRILMEHRPPLSI